MRMTCVGFSGMKVGAAAGSDVSEVSAVHCHGWRLQLAARAFERERVCVWGLMMRGRSTVTQLLGTLGAV